MAIAAEAGRCGDRSSQDRANARHQLGGLEWLGQIIVRAHLQPLNAIVGIAARGQHQHRRAGVLPDTAQHVETVRVGHHHVQHDQGVVFGEGSLDSRRAAGSPADFEPFARQIARDELAELGIVVNNQHAFHGGVLHSKARCGSYTVKMCQGSSP